MNLAQAKGELITAKICQRRWQDRYNITHKLKYVELAREALQNERRFRRTINEIEDRVLIKKARKT